MIKAWESTQSKTVPVNTAKQVTPRGTTARVSDWSASIPNKFGMDVSNRPTNPLNPSNTAVDTYNSTIMPKAKIQGGDIKNAFSQILPGTVQTLKDIKSDPLNIKNSAVKSINDVSSLGPLIIPKKALSEAWNVIKGAVSDEGQRIKELIDSRPKNGQFDLAKAIGSDLRASTGAANVVFSPLTALFNGANKVPILGTVSKIITLPFQAAGESAAGLGNAIVNKLPISQEAKDKIKPGVQEIFSLAAQIGLGKAGIDVKVWDGLKSKFGETDATTIVRQAQNLAHQKQIAETPKIEQPIETPQTIKVGQGNDFAGYADENASFDGTYKPSKPFVEDQVSIVEPKNQTKAAKIANDVNTEIVSKGFEAMPEEQQAQFNPITKKETVSKVAEFMAKDIEAAKESIRTGQVPNDVHKQVLFNAMEERALKEGDVQGLRDLASSPIASELSISAQALGASGFNKAEGAVSAIREVIKAREESSIKKYGNKATNQVKTQIKEEVTKTIPKAKDWASFLDELKCT